MGVVCMLHDICVLHVACVWISCCLLLLASIRRSTSSSSTISKSSSSGAPISPGGGETRLFVGATLGPPLLADAGVAASPDAGVEIRYDSSPRFAPGSSAGWMVPSPDAALAASAVFCMKIAPRSGPAMLASMAFSLSDKDVGGRAAVGVPLAAAAGAGVGAAGPAAGHRLWLHGSARVHGSELPAPPAPRSKWRTGKTPVSCGLSASSAKVAGNDRGPDA